MGLVHEMPSPMSHRRGALASQMVATLSRLYPKLGIDIEETDPSIGIPASMISVWYRKEKNARLHQLSPVPDRIRHR
jgi:hypothetical protein